MKINPFKRRALSYQKQNWLFLLPYLVGTLLLVVLPTLMTVAVAFTSYNAIQSPTWAGLANFKQVFESPLIRLSIRNTMIFMGLAVPLRIAGALALAVLLQPPRRGAGVYRAAVYLPTIIPEVAYGLVWLWIFNPVSGPLNAILAGLGLPAPAWLAEASTARLAMVIMAVFQLGEGFIVLLAALQNVPTAFYQAAQVDGANRWQCFRHITLPALTPWLLLLTFRDLIFSLQNTFAPTFVMTYGGPYYATTFIPLLVYELAFDFGDLGLASAVLVVTMIWVGLLVIGIRNIIEGLRGEEEES